MTNLMVWDDKESPPRSDALHTAGLVGLAEP